MGGYGGASGKTKGKCYYDSQGFKVDEPNSIRVADYYIAEGKYVVFLHNTDGQYRADLSVDGIHTEVKGLTSLSPNTIEKTLHHAVEQVHGDDFKYPPETHRKGKIIFLSNHSSSIPQDDIIASVKSAYDKGKMKGYIDCDVEVWIRGKIFVIN